MALEGLGIAESVIVALSAKVVSLCLPYLLAVNNATKDITRLATEVKNLQEVVKEIRHIINGPNDAKLSVSEKVAQRGPGLRRSAEGRRENTGSAQAPQSYESFWLSSFMLAH
jgi:hypothetical protein